MVETGSAAGVGYRRGVFEACRAMGLEAATHITIAVASSDFLIFIPRE